MGYDVHITRAPNWLENAEAPIPFEEWVAYVKSDPEMRLENFAEVQSATGVLRYENPGIAVWTAYSRHGEGGNVAWFDFRDGHVVVKDPDEEILGKICRIAEALGARVQGDEGEYYPESLRAHTTPQGEPNPKGTRWWRKLLRRG